MKKHFRFYLSIVVSLVFIIGIASRASSLLHSPLLFVKKAMALYSSSNLQSLNVSSTDFHTALYHERIVSKIGVTKEVHAATLVENDQNQLLAFWYGGSREGAKDVAIFKSTFNEHIKTWEHSQPLFDRIAVEKDLGRYIKKVGNPVVVKDLNNRLWLFFVTVSVGGWAGSSINYRISTDHGETWQPSRRLVTSPFLNLSTLVKGTPILYQDGSIGLPVYHEFLGKFSFLIRIDQSGRIVASSRMTHAREAIQPSLLIKDEKNIEAYLRFTGKEPNKIMLSYSNNAGVSWSFPEKMSLPNPNAAVAVLSLDQNLKLLVFNNTMMHRNVLSLAVSEQQGEPWRVVHNFEHEKVTPNDYGFSYPVVLSDQEGDVHVLYSWKRKYIKEVVFNRAWLVTVLNKNVAGLK